MDGVPDKQNYMVVFQAGEHLIDSSTGEDRDGQWRCHVNVSGEGGISSAMPALREFTGEGVSAQHEETVDPGTPLVLLRLRNGKVTAEANGGQSTSEDPQPCDGLMIWIEPQK